MISIMQNRINSIIDAIIKELNDCYLNYSFDIDDFINSNDVDFNNFIDFIENEKFDIIQYFFKRFRLVIKKYNIDSTPDFEKFASNWFLAFLDYCYYLQIKEKKRTKEFKVPSKDAFKYKMNNDNRIPISKNYNLNIHLQETL
jgi:hypothetical protein